MTNVEMMRQLAEATKECPEHYVAACAMDGPVLDCPTACGCRGSGRIPLLPSLGVQCSNPWCHDGKAGNGTCMLCEGHARLGGEPHIETLLAAMEEAGFSWIANGGPAYVEWEFWSHLVDDVLLDPNPYAAALKAVEAVLV